MGKDAAKEIAKDRKITVKRDDEKKESKTSNVKAGTIKKRVTKDNFQYFAFAGFSHTDNALEIFKLICEHVSDYLGEFILEVVGLLQALMVCKQLP